LWEYHNGVAGGHVRGKVTAQKILHTRLWWSIVFKDAKDYSRACDVFPRVGKPLHVDDFPLHHIHALQAFEKWSVEFIGPSTLPAKHLKERYIITATDYITCWTEAEPVRDCSIDTTTKFIFENIITLFGCHKV